MCNDNCICRAAWIVDPDALKSFLAVLCAVAHPLTNEKTWSLAEREGEDVSPSLACSHSPGSGSVFFYKAGEEMAWHQDVKLGVAGGRKRAKR